MTAVHDVRLDRPDPEHLLQAGLILGAQALALLAYAARPDVAVGDPLVLLVPFVWIDAAVLAVIAADPPAPGSRRRLAAALAVGYFLVLSAVGGLFSLGGSPPATASGLSVVMGRPPGWSPTLQYLGPDLMVTLPPYKVAGYAALAYLVYATVADAASAGFGGLVGLFSCVSCTWPVLGTALTAVLGGSSALTAVALGDPYLTSTAVFLSALAILSVRPVG